MHPLQISTTFTDHAAPEGFSQRQGFAGLTFPVFTARITRRFEDRPWAAQRASEGNAACAKAHASCTAALRRAFLRKTQPMHYLLNVLWED